MRATEHDEQLQITVDHPDGQSALIKHLSAYEAHIMLSISSCPSANPDPLLHLTKASADLSPLSLMLDKAMTWAEKAKQSQLCAHDIHFCVRSMFFRKVRYSL